MSSALNELACVMCWGLTSGRVNCLAWSCCNNATPTLTALSKQNDGTQENGKWAVSMWRFFQSHKSAFPHSNTYSQGIRHARRRQLIGSNSSHVNWRATRTSFRPSIDSPIDGRQFVAQLCCVLLPSMPTKGLLGFYTSYRDGNDSLSLSSQLKYLCTFTIHGWGV